jgi:hypothetical protein
MILTDSKKLAMKGVCLQDLSCWLRLFLCLLFSGAIVNSGSAFTDARAHIFSVPRTIPPWVRKNPLAHLIRSAYHDDKHPLPSSC